MHDDRGVRERCVRAVQGGSSQSVDDHDAVPSPARSPVQMGGSPSTPLLKFPVVAINSSRSSGRRLAAAAAAAE